MPRRPSRIATLQEQCTQKRALLLSRRVATAEEIAEWWPGGAQNTAKNWWGWIRCFGKLEALLDRKHPDVVEQERLAKQREILKALADEPEVVALVAREPDDEARHRTITVYPKGYLALVEVHARNLLLASLTDDMVLLEQHGRPDDVELLVRAQQEQAYLQRVIAWIATTAGPGLPFAEGEQAPPVPALYGELHPADLYAIATAFQRVNVLRLLALESSRGTEKRPDWSVFFASLAGTQQTPTPVLMRDMSLATVLASAAERARGQEAASRERTPGPPGPSVPPHARHLRRVS